MAVPARPTVATAGQSTPDLLAVELGVSDARRADARRTDARRADARRADARRTDARRTELGALRRWDIKEFLLS